MSNKNITRDIDGLSQLQLVSVGDKMPKWEPAVDIGFEPSGTHG